MALLPTLTEIRTATLARCGIASSGNIQRNIKDLLDEKIRSAHEQLYEMAPWLVNYVEGTITLDAGVSDYDIPDDTDAGHIDAIGVRQSEDGHILRLEPGIRLGEASHLTSDALPERFTFIDRVIRIASTPDTTRYDVLVLQYWQTPGALTNDADRIVVDGEACKALAEILVKEHFGGVDTQRLREDLGRYIERKRSKQSDGSGFRLCAVRSFRTTPSARNRFGMTTLTYGDNWRPWV